jgi:hypothetical protein
MALITTLLVDDDEMVRDSSAKYWSKADLR